MSIVDIRGMGLLFACQFDSEISGKVVSSCNQLGLLLNQVKPNAIRLMPPLTVTEHEIDLAVSILDEGITEANK